MLLLLILITFTIESPNHTLNTIEVTVNCICNRLQHIRQGGRIYSEYQPNCSYYCYTQNYTHHNMAPVVSIAEDVNSRSINNDRMLNCNIKTIAATTTQNDTSTAPPHLQYITDAVKSVTTSDNGTNCVNPKSGFYQFSLTVRRETVRQQSLIRN